jgi:hypothetical protein
VVCKFLLILSASISAPSLAQNRKVRIDDVVNYWSREIVRETAAEFSHLSEADAKWFYGAFVDEKFRARLMLWTGKPKVHAEGKVLVMEFPNAAPIRIEATDLFHQKYKINGKAFTFDFHGNPLTDMEVIEKGLRSSQHAFFQYLIPEVQAQPAQLVVGAIRLLLPRLAVGLAAEGVVAEATLTAVETAEANAAREAGWPHLLKALEAGGEELMGKAAAALMKNPKFEEKITQMVVQNLLDSPQAQAQLAKGILGESLKKGGMSLSSALMQTFAIGVPVSASGYVALYSIATTYKLDPSVVFKCFATLQGLNNCTYVDTSMPGNKQPKLSITKNWCNVDKVPEYQASYESPSGNGDRIIGIVRLAPVTDKERSGSPIWARTMVQHKDGTVDEKSFRTYDFSMEEKAGLTVASVCRPILKPNVKFEIQTAYPPRLENVSDAKQEADMFTKVDARDGYLKDTSETCATVLTTAQIKKYRADKNAAGLDGNSKEMQGMFDLMLLYATAKSECGSVQGADVTAKAAEAAPATAPAGDAAKSLKD